MPTVPIQPDPPRRIGKRRRRLMMGLTILLWGIIGAYAFYTNESRVRAMAGGYLADLLGGQVTIGQADLSLFEGLRLNHVRISVPDAPDAASTLLDADVVLIHYSLSGLLSGHFNATQIIVVNPRVCLAEDLSTGQWNYQLLRHGRWRSPRQVAGGAAPMPEVLLRDARVDYLELNNGKARSAGWMALDGRFGPSGSAGHYDFNFQSRGRQNLGPAVQGSVDPISGHVKATLSNVIYGSDIEAMLPALVRQWCRDHDLSGRVSVAVEYAAGEDYFRVQADLDDVDLTVHPRAGSPLTFHNAAGSLTFTKDQVTAGNLNVEFDNNRYAINGAIEGYTTDSPLDLTLRSADDFDIAENIPFVASLPPAAREIYNRFHPSGRGAATVRLQRLQRGQPIRCTAQIDVLDGGFIFADIPYPIAHAKGRILVGPDEKLGFDVVRLVDIRGSGIPGSVNQNAQMSVDGWIGPFNSTAGGSIEVRGQNVRPEKRLRDSLPPPAQNAMDLLDANHAGFGPAMTASFVSHALRPHAGQIPDLPWIIEVDLDLHNGQACYAGFPYPLQNIAAKLKIHPDSVDVLSVEATHGLGKLHLDGHIDFAGGPDHVLPDLNLRAVNLPIDDQLLAALPPEPKQRLTAAGLRGQLDAAGPIHTGYDLALTLHDASLSPGGNLAIDALAGQLHLTPVRVDVADLHGRRGSGLLAAKGMLDWSTPRRQVTIALDAQSLPLNDQLLSFLPPPVQTSLNPLHPTGTVDATLEFDTTTSPGGTLKINLRPSGLSVSPKLAADAAPFNLDGVSGAIAVIFGKQAQWNITGRHGPGTLKIAGSWMLDNPAAPWNLQLSGADIPIDADLIRQMPGGLAAVLRALGLTGSAGFEFSKLSYHQQPATRPIDGRLGPDVEFAVKVTCHDGSMTMGVPLTNLDGSADLTGVIRNGELHELSGDLQADNLLLAGRKTSDLIAKISKPADESTVHISGLQATVADGRLAGDLAVQLSDAGPSQYAIRAALDGADVRQLTGDTDTKINGNISASLEMSGSATDPDVRRGHGDVRVYGGQMYQIPLVLGLFQVTNLALPISSPFERAGARYSVQGQRVTLEQIQLSGKDLAMEGGGHIDFGTKQVDLNFVTANPNWLSFPLLGSMWRTAHGELLRIHVKGSLQSPKVSASSLDTITTTVDQVLKGDAAKDNP